MLFGKLSVGQGNSERIPPADAPEVPDVDTRFGRKVTAQEVASLLSDTMEPDPAVDLPVGEMTGDAGARMMAEAIVPDPMSQGVVIKTAKGGRVNIIAQRTGVFQLDEDRIVAMNTINPAIAVATIPNLKRVTAGMTVVAIKALTQGVCRTAVAQASEAANQDTQGDALGDAQGNVQGALTVRGAQLTTATLIETHYPGARMAPNGRRALEERLDRLGAQMTQVMDIPHDEDAIAQAINRATAEVIVLLTAADTAATTDCVPNGLRRAGGQVERFGMPVLPGWEVVVGHHAGKPVIGLPVSARSVVLNGADWVLERVLCGLPVQAADIAAMGVGGLLEDPRERGRFR